MLSQLFIRHFTIIEQTSIEFSHGMTVLTGETGAGKSILVDALGLALGNRADSKWVRSGCRQAEISAGFAIQPDTPAYQWLLTHDFPIEENELLLRRTLGNDGRSKAFINGSPVTVQQLKTLGKLLVNIHGQHEHHALLNKANQLARLDHFADHDQLVLAVQQAYQNWKNAIEQLTEAQHNLTTQQSQQALLQYQVAELDRLSLAENEIGELEQEHNQLSHAQHLLETSGTVLDTLQENPEQTLLGQLGHLQKLLADAAAIDNKLANIHSLLNEAHINLQEATQELRHYHDDVALDPERLNHLDQRLQAIHNLARKHQVVPETLYQFHHDLVAQLQQLSQSAEHLVELEQSVAAAEKQYLAAAAKLTDSRQKAAKKLAPAITDYMQQLGMNGGRFELVFQHNEHYTIQGMETVEFQVSTNPGQPLQPMQTIVSGGELSRISLAIQVLTAAKQPTPTLIFDEVDVGIGGGTAEVVGNLLRQLGKHCQVLCVTHLPQVAVQGHHHLRVNKIKAKDSTVSELIPLTTDDRHTEIARMLGGVEITAQTLAHAKEMLGQV